jgi:hypothetical protein
VQPAAEGLASLASAASGGADALCRLDCDEELADSCSSHAPPPARALQQTSRCRPRTTTRLALLPCLQLWYLRCCAPALAGKHIAGALCDMPAWGEEPP